MRMPTALKAHLMMYSQAIVSHNYTGSVLADQPLVDNDWGDWSGEHNIFVYCIVMSVFVCLPLCLFFVHWHNSTRSSADAEGLHDMPQIRKITLAKGCNRATTFKDTQGYYSCCCWIAIYKYMYYFLLVACCYNIFRPPI